MNRKILTTIIIIFLAFVVFNLNEVYGVGIISQSWKQDVNGDGKLDLIFRQYTTPHPNTIRAYHNIKKTESVEGGIWKYKHPDDNKLYISGWVDTRNGGVEMPSSVGTFRTIGYAFHTERMGTYNNGSSIGYNLPKNPLGQWMSTISEAYKSSSIVYATPGIQKNYKDVVFYELMKITPTYTNEFITSYAQNKKTQLRYCIVAIDGVNVHVSDNVIYGDDLVELVKLVNKKKNEGKIKNDTLYISDIIVTKANSSENKYKVAKTAAEFYKLGPAWSSSSKGLSGNKAMGSVANLYDNELILPQMSKRTVLVRHINVGSNTVINTEIISNSSRISSTNLKFTASNPEQNITGSRTSSTYSGYEEYYEKLIDIDRGVKKIANKETSTYKCLGYNVAVSTSLAYAEETIENQIRIGRFTKGTTVTVNAQPATSNSDYVVIDFYYTEYEEEVYVNHLFVDKNGYVKEMKKQTIVPNKTATINNSTIYKTNDDKYISEVYQKKLGYNVYTRNADSLKNDNNIIYMGYELFNSKVEPSTLEGKQRTALNTDSTAKLTSKDIQVNYYYYYETKQEEVEPEKDIGGKLFIYGTEEKYTADCLDEQEKKPITSIPSGTSAKVGINGIPRYMVGAITTEYVSPVNSEDSMDLSLTLKMGTQTKTINIDNIKYRVGYYKVTDLVVYRLQSMKIYDADNGYSGTLGSSLFDWKNGTLTLTPNKMNLDVKLIGIKGEDEPINPKDASAINDINNYVAVEIEDKYGRKSEKGDTASTLETVYLDENQLKEVDANGDGKVTLDDKTIADNKLKEYNNILTEKKEEQVPKQTAYNNAVTTRNALSSNLESAIKERDRLEGIYNDKKDKKTELEDIKERSEDDLQKLNELVQEEKAKKQTYDDAVNAEEKLQDLYNKYEKYIQELDLKSKCEDEVTEDCITEEQYNEAVKDNAAKRNYDEYLNGDYTTDKEKYDKAKNEYDKAKGNVDQFLSEKGIIIINNREMAIASLETTANTSKDKLQKYIKEEYRPAQKEYIVYRDKIVPKAQAAYAKDVDDKNVENAATDLQRANDAVTTAQSDYDTYNTYVTNLYTKYDSYKKLYDDYIAINESTAVDALELKLNVYVQNMIVKVNDTTLTSSEKNTEYKQYSIANLINNKTIPQVTTGRSYISPDVYSNIGSTLMQKSDFTNSNKISEEKLNGISVLAGEANYAAQVVIGNKSVNAIEDTIYYSDQSSDENVVVFKLKNNNITKTYRMDSSAITFDEKYAEVEPVNIYTPITVSAELTSENKDIVNQVKDAEVEDSIIQINAPFTIKLGSTGSPKWENGNNKKYNINDTNEFAAGYYVRFDFDVHKVKINGKLYNKGNRIPAGTWIGIIPNKGKGNTYITAQAYANLEGNELDIVNEKKTNYYVRAVAYNATDIMLSKSTKYQKISEMTKDTSDLKDIVNNICINPSYFAEMDSSVVIANRVYDFKVTDVKDVNWKSVFRTNTGSATNKHNSIVYYSGTTKWNTNSEKINDIINRSTSEIGKNPLRILPIGPYKHTNSTYVNAPKIGYRFSFDMKVTGSYYNTENAQLKPNEDKKVTINTTFYYISKDGKKYLPEYYSNKEQAGIYLFYKTSTGKYVRIDGNGGGYSLYFTPNDGYRYITDTNTSTLATTSVLLGHLRKLTLTHNMATVANNGSVITYYGEYKLPNSTIAVEVDENGNYDINKPLSNGYIGVVFDIVVSAGTVEIQGKKQQIELSYSKNTILNKENTSQWDYEGFLGYSTDDGDVGENNTIKIKLEKGTWVIKDNTTYNQIKGSVMLYDLDQRAATDYE